MSKRAIIMYGPPGAGKGTQAELLSRKMNVTHFDTGRYIESLVHSKEAGTDPVLKQEQINFDEGKLCTPSWVLNIIEETTKFLRQQGINSVGLISTVITKRHRLYEKDFESAGIRVVLPDDLEQAKISSVIHNLVMNRQGNKEREELIKIIEKFKIQGIKNVILACTDLQLLILEHGEIKIHDTMKILAESTINEILK